MKLRCPQCSTLVEADTDPVRCPNCGFSAPLPPGMGRAPAPVAPSAPTAPPPSTYYSAPNLSRPQTYASPYGAPPTTSIYRGTRPVGKTRGPGLVVLFSIITIFLYTFVWMWKI